MQMSQAVQEHDSTLSVQSGTYGNIQRMRNVSNDGPFTHVLEF